MYLGASICLYFLLLLETSVDCYSPQYQSFHRGERRTWHYDQQHETLIGGMNQRMMVRSQEGDLNSEMEQDPTVLKDDIVPNDVAKSITEVIDLSFLEEGSEGSEPADIQLKESVRKSLIRGTDSKVRRSIAAVSTLFGCLLFAFQFSEPVNGVALLHAMEKDSLPLTEALCNGKPTMVEFYADWCESCKELAPTMRGLELKFKNNINFVTLNGMDPKNLGLVDVFGVDGIPHMAFITDEAEVQTALVGAVPESILSAELIALKQGKSLPVDGYDAYEGKPTHYPFGKSSSLCTMKPDQ